MARNKEAIKQFDFIRAVACIGIVLYPGEFVMPISVECIGRVYSRVFP